MEQESSEEESLRDEDWAAVRAAVPSFAETWLTITQDESYDGTLPFVTIHEFATHIVEKVIRERPEEVQALAEMLEYEFTIAALHDREQYAGLLRVGLLEGLIEAADKIGMPLTKLVPLLSGPRTRGHWSAAVAYKRPGRVWDDKLGAVPTFALPSAVGTIEIHRGRRLDQGRYLLDARLVSGDVSIARFIRQEAGKNFWVECRILKVSHRSADLPDEFEIEVESHVRDGIDPWDYRLPRLHKRFWQLADGSSQPERRSPNEDF